MLKTREKKRHFCSVLYSSMMTLTLVVLSSCSLFQSSSQDDNRPTTTHERKRSFEQLAPRPPKQYSPTVEEEFQRIERDQVQELERTRAVENYYQMRLKDQEDPERIQRRREEMIAREREQQRLMRESTPSTVDQTPSPGVQDDSVATEVTVPTEIPQTAKIEAQQNIDYFCIQHEDRQDWSDAENCQEFGEKQLNYCRERYFSRNQSNFVQCVKQRLGV